jgi:hypothetical protein
MEGTTWGAGVDFVDFLWGYGAVGSYHACGDARGFGAEDVAL